MGKARVHEVAKEIGIPVAQAVRRLKEAGFSVKSHASGVDRDAALLVLRASAEEEEGAVRTPRGAADRPKKKRRPRRRAAVESPPGVIVIKKYGNRRLYSTAESRYLTLEELEQIIREGRGVQVVDASTGEDLTSQVLTQILLEGGRARRFPVAFLEQIIRLGDDALQTFFGRYLMTGLDMFLSAQREMERRYHQGMGGFGLWPFPGFGGQSGDWFGAARPADSSPPGAPAPTGPAPAAAPSAAPPPVSPAPAASGGGATTSSSADQGEVEALRRRLEDLERMISRNAQPQHYDED